MVQLITARITPRMNRQVQAFFNAAVNMNDINTVKRLIKHQKEAIDIEATNNDGIAPVHKCAIEGNTKMISVLLRAGADINAVDHRGWTCLHAAARAGNLKLCKYLLRKGANPMLYTSNKELAIEFSTHSAVTYLLVEMIQLQGYIEVARYHLSRAMAQQKQEMESELIQDTTDSPQTLNSILKRSRSKSERWNGSVRSSWSSASSASSSSYFSSAADDSEASSSSSSSSSLPSGRLSVQFPTNTLFLNYIHENEHELLDALLDQNRVSILNKLDRKGLSTIHWAAINGFHDCIRVLVKHGADVDIVDPNGWTPLHASVITGNIECVKELLSCSARVDAVTNNGESVFDMTTDREIQHLLERRIK